LDYEKILKNEKQVTYYKI